MSSYDFVEAALNLWMDELCSANEAKRKKAWAELEAARDSPDDVPLLELAAIGINSQPDDVLEQFEQSAKRQIERGYITTRRWRLRKTTGYQPKRPSWKWSA